MQPHYHGPDLRLSPYDYLMLFQVHSWISYWHHQYYKRISQNKNQKGKSQLESCAVLSSWSSVGNSWLDSSVGKPPGLECRKPCQERIELWVSLFTPTQTALPCIYLSLTARLSRAPECVWKGIMATQAGVLWLRTTWWPLYNHPLPFIHESLARPHSLIHSFNNYLSSIWVSGIALDAGNTKTGKGRSLPLSSSQPTGRSGKSVW